MTTRWRESVGLITLCVGLAAATISPARAVTDADCRHRVNSTQERLLACIRRDVLWQHLVELQKIADANPGAQGHANRNIGTKGYRASVEYVTRLMQKAGYHVQIQAYPWKRSRTVGTPQLTIDGHVYREATDWFVAGLSGSGQVHAAIAAPGLESETSTGCDSASFHGFARGSVALLKRGACDFDTQVANAQAAGASAVILYNDKADIDANGPYRKHARGEAFSAMLSQPANIPVIGALSYEDGAALAAQSRSGNAPVAALSVQTELFSRKDYNVIADSPYGDDAHTVVVEGHLDAIHGAGILDNGSGSSTILEIARNLANTPTKNHLRFIWFGGEEIGLLGSKYYVSALSPAELKKIAFDIDVDVTATPNYAILIADPGHAHAADKFPKKVIRDSQPGNHAFLEYFRSIGIASRIASFGNDGTDSIPFSFAGVPNTGILTQQDCCKHDWEVRLWGGFTGNFEGNIPSHDGGCVDNPGRWCDNLSNNDRGVLEFVSKATAAVVLKFANDGGLGRKK
ncbi:MAG TPA: M28 family peptidase [Rhizomicrobium sp.]|nr:M28 family peptidase [Rhizomicrobium sp.]